MNPLHCFLASKHFVAQEGVVQINFYLISPLCREKLFSASEDDRIEEAELSGLMNQTLQIEKEVTYSRFRFNEPLSYI